jgi:hypothetical protein
MTLTEFFDILPLVALYWAIHLIPAIIPAAYWLWQRGKSRLTAVDPFVLTIPYVVLFAMYFAPLRRKSMVNLMCEPFLLGSLIAVFILARMIFRPGGLSRTQSLVVCVLSVGVALAVYFSVPAGSFN